MATFVRSLEEAGDLIRVTDQVSPLLEPASLAVRESLEPCGVPGSDVRDQEAGHLGGKALLFEHVEGCDFPLLMNAFGSASRIERALRCRVGGLESLAESVASLVKIAPPSGMLDAIAKARDMLPLLRLAPRLVKRGVCQEVVHRADRGEVDLTKLPLIKCWPLDGDPAAVGWPLDARQAGTALGQGRFITLGGMHTIHADDAGLARPASHNIGMYRAQLIGPTQLAMHWHVHHDGAAHWRSWKEAGKPMPIAICFGGEPVLPYAATAPLPPRISELLMAGFLEGRGIPLVPAKTVPLRVPANSEIVIEGFVRTDAGPCGWMPGDGPIGEGAVLEGPFGDHTGYYSLPDRYPIVDVTAVTQRCEAIFPATVVGPPPQEDFWLGKATERLFRPLLQTLVPDIIDYTLPMAGCFHNWAVVGIKKAYAMQARRVMHAIWGAGQMAWTKCVLVVDASEVDVHDHDAVLRAMFTHVNFGRDVERVRGPLDILDHAAQTRGAGGKIGFDATPRWPGEEAGSAHAEMPRRADAGAIMSALPDGAVVPEWGRGRCVLTHRPAAPPTGWEGLCIHLDDDVDLDNCLHVWFHTLASMDPMRDITIENGVMTIDARSKQHDPVRPWPPFLGWA